MREHKETILPFLKWAGGKRWFVRQYDHLIPERFNRYIEPFLGSGAMFFHVRPERAVLGDSNRDLIDTYKGIKQYPGEVAKILRKHQRLHNDHYYYRMRDSASRSLAGAAARLIYLNRTCWNGLYRVNKEGQFNVPIGTKSSIVREEDDFAAVSRILRKAKLTYGDFEVVVNKTEEGDFLFVDPPYTVSHNQNAFIKYNEKLFSWKDQMRLAEALVRAKKRGVMILATNACHKSVIKLYGSGFTQEKASRMSVIAGSNESRKQYKELVISANLL